MVGRMFRDACTGAVSKSLHTRLFSAHFLSLVFLFEISVRKIRIGVESGYKQMRGSRWNARNHGFNKMSDLISRISEHFLGIRYESLRIRFGGKFHGFRRYQAPRHLVRGLESSEEPCPSKLESKIASRLLSNSNISLVDQPQTLKTRNPKP
jgi:hypothetical protein